MTRVSQRHVVFKASEQIKSAKRKSRKSRREITSCSKNGSAQIRRNRIPGKNDLPEFNLAKDNQSSRSKFVRYFGSTSSAHRQHLTYQSSRSIND